MEWVETTGRTVEEAKDRALDQLGVDEQDAEFEVLEEPKTGLFGRLRSEARVRARVRPTKPRPKEDRRDKRRRGGRNDSGGGSQASESRDRGEKTPGKAEKAGAAEGAGSAEAAAGAEGGQRRSAGGGGGGGGRRRGGGAGAGGAGGGGGRAGSTGGGQRTRGAERDGDDRNERNEREETKVSEDVALAEQGAVAREFLEGLLTEFGAEGSVEVEELDEDIVEVRVTGDDLGLLIGPKGATLAALQDVTRTVVQRQTGGRNGRLMVDVAGYRQKRREALERFTRQIAEQVKETGVRKVLEPMSAADRKVVHDTANTIDGVSTTSEGEDPRRRVVIQPA